MAKKKAYQFNPPRTEEELARYIGIIGDLQRELAAHRISFEAAVAELANDWENLKGDLPLQVQARFEACFEYAQAKRVELTVSGKKSLELSSGQIGWRTAPPAVALDRGVKAEVVIGRLKAAGLSHLVRIVEEIDREAILKDPPAIVAVVGVSVVQHEDFWLKPGGDKTSEISKRISKQAGRKKKIA